MTDKLDRLLELAERAKTIDEEGYDSMIWPLALRSRPFPDVIIALVEVAKAIQGGWVVVNGENADEAEALSKALDALDEAMRDA